MRGEGLLSLSVCEVRINYIKTFVNFVVPLIKSQNRVEFDLMAGRLGGSLSVKFHF